MVLRKQWSVNVPRCLPSSSRKLQIRTKILSRTNQKSCRGKANYSKRQANTFKGSYSFLSYNRRTLTSGSLQNLVRSSSSLLPTGGQAFTAHAWQTRQKVYLHLSVFLSTSFITSSSVVRTMLQTSVHTTGIKRPHRLIQLAFQCGGAIGKSLQSPKQKTKTFQAITTLARVGG